MLPRAWNFKPKVGTLILTPTPLSTGALGASAANQRPHDSNRSKSGGHATANTTEASINSKYSWQTLLEARWDGPQVFSLWRCCRSLLSPPTLSFALSLSLSLNPLPYPVAPTLPPVTWYAYQYYSAVPLVQFLFSARVSAPLVPRVPRIPPQVPTAFAASPSAPAHRRHPLRSSI